MPPVCLTAAIGNWLIWKLHLTRWLIIWRHPGRMPIKRAFDCRRANHACWLRRSIRTSSLMCWRPSICVAWNAGLKNISRMVTDLACLLRGNIGVGSSQKITFEQELGYVHYYLDLQRERFGEKLSYSVEYEDEDLLRYLVPRLTIQPLVENAIVHGWNPGGA